MNSRLGNILRSYMDDYMLHGEGADEEAPRRPDPDELDPTRVLLRPVADEQVGDLRWIHERPGVVRRWGEPEADFPFDRPELTRLTILVDGQVGGMIQYWEEDDPRCRQAGLDLFVDPALQNKGIGTRAIRDVARYLFEARGHHRIQIDPAADNQAAIRLSEKVGFKPVGITRRSERDHDGLGWHDCLLMEMLATEYNPGEEP